jgi:CheY-like chemotaxis protein
MPVLNGIEATRRLREMEASGEIPRRTVIIGLTGNAQEEQVAETKEAGMDVSASRPLCGSTRAHVGCPTDECLSLSFLALLTTAYDNQGQSSPLHRSADQELTPIRSFSTCSPTRLTTSSGPLRVCKLCSALPFHPSPPLLSCTPGLLPPSPCIVTPPSLDSQLSRPPPSRTTSVSTSTPHGRRRAPPSLFLSTWALHRISRTSRNTSLYSFFAAAFPTHDPDAPLLAIAPSLR